MKISLKLGVLSDELLQKSDDLWHRAYMHCREVNSQRHRLLSYQYAEHQYGHSSLRRIFAERHGIGANQIFCTAGVRSAYTLALSLTKPDQRSVAITVPIYSRLMGALAHLKFLPIGVSTSAEGIDMDSLEAACALNPAALVISYPHANPIGNTYSQAQFDELIQVCRLRNLPLIIDSMYQEHWYERPAEYLDLSQYSDVPLFLIGGTNKTLPGGAGYVATSLQNGEVLTALQQSFVNLESPPSMLRQEELAWLMEEKLYQSHLKEVCTSNGTRLKALQGALTEHCPNIQVPLVEGGYFIGVRLPRPQNMQELCIAAHDRDVVITTSNPSFPIGLNNFHPFKGDYFKRYNHFLEGTLLTPGQKEVLDHTTYNSHMESGILIRLGFTHLEPLQIHEAISRIAPLL